MLHAQGSSDAQQQPSTRRARASWFSEVLPHYPTTPDKDESAPRMSSREKFQLAANRAFQPSSFLLAGVYAGYAQATDRFPDWGQGAEGFGKRYGAAYADLAIGHYATKAIFPILFHQDPRYFRMNHGSTMARIGYAISRIAITRSDAGRAQFNYSEFVGTSVAAGIANAYYPEANRTFEYTAQTIGLNLGTDALFNLGREFWPDVRRHFHKGAPKAP